MSQNNMNIQTRNNILKDDDKQLHIEPNKNPLNTFKDEYAAKVMSHSSFSSVCNSFNAEASHSILKICTIFLSEID